jgi:ribosomal protein S6
LSTAAVWLRAQIWSDESAMPYYHVYMLARPDATRDLLLEMLSRMSTTIVQRGGVLRGIDNLGIRHMAYVMRRHQHVATVARYRAHGCGCSNLSFLS